MSDDSTTSSTARRLLATANQGADVITRDSDGAVFIQREVAERAINQLLHTLAFYASPEHYDGGEVPGHVYILDDDGRYAREALGLPTWLSPDERFDIKRQCSRIWSETL